VLLTATTLPVEYDGMNSLKVMSLLLNPAGHCQLNSCDYFVIFPSSKTHDSDLR
jgi:hypothetical protein